MKSLIFLLTATASTTALASLPSVGPDYHTPTAPTPTAYRDLDNAASWKVGEPSEQLARGPWWQAFGDTTLNDIESRALVANQDLRAAAARVEEARAAAGITRSSRWPQLAFDGSLTRERTSETTDNPLPDSSPTTFRAPLTAVWELDLFGRVRRLNESARADAEASAAAFESVRLALTSDVASDYFLLRGLDRELGIVRDTVELRRKALSLVQTRVKSGTAAELDAARAEAELASTEADAAALANRRAALQNALAVLVGEPASAFAVAFPSTDDAPLAVPAGLPSELLERRPDVAAAERTLASANARIGVAKAAFFPAISLTGSAGFASADIDSVFNSDSRIWSIGPRLYLPIFQGGRNKANLERSRAAFDEAVATYRQRVLVAFREVQDALTATRLLGTQTEAQDRALGAARRAADLAQVRYEAGYVSYLEVIDAQRTVLAAQRASTQLAALRLQTNVALVKALGGGWHRPDTLVAQR